MIKTKEKHKIMWLHSHLLYWMGGTKFIYEVIKRLKDDFEIMLIVENSTNEAIKKYESIGIKAVSLNKLTSNSPIYWATLPLQILIDYIKIKKIANKYKYKVVVSSMFPMNVIAYLFKSKHVQYCFEPFAFFHDPQFVNKFHPIKRSLIKLASILYKQLDIFATRKSDSVITLNNTTLKFIKEIYGIKATVSYAGIDANHFHPFVSKKIAQKYKGKDVIVHSTDYTPVKGTELMISIFSEVKKKRPQARLLITSTINNRQEENRLKKIASSLGIIDEIEFLGFVDYNILPQIYSLAKVLVQCSFSERSGTTSMALPVKEAMACGTLCIRYPIAGEDVENGITGFLVDPRNKRKMVESIIKILDMKPNIYKYRSILARSTVVNKYNWIYTSNIIKKIIKETIPNDKTN